MKYRSMNEIFASILSSVTENDGLDFTKIMCNCYLSYGQVTRFLQFANENDFLVYDNNTELFKITNKGLQFLELYGKMDNLHKERQTGVIGSVIILLLYALYPLFPVLGDFI
ncbi:MAG TPA: winged helix-turn-helix domain-containing protein [Nitrososphaeraceae archaeon]|nr:winged helix-turn-helix domain-containing protein [Nitrososphaeraceae archaeon]